MIIEKLPKIDRFHVHYAKWEETKSFDSFLTVRASYWDMLGSGYTDDRTDAFTVTPAMLRIFRETKQPIPNWISSEILLLLVEPEKLEAFLQMPNSEPLLAWYCCTRSVIYSDIDKIVLSDQFKELLQKWTGKAIDAKSLPTLDKVVDCLYGKNCWTLYGQNIDEDPDEDTLTALANEIANLHIPLEHASHRQVIIELRLDNLA